MNGTATETVASSWIEALGGESMCWILSTPPAFWAAAGLATASASSAMMQPKRLPWVFIGFLRDFAKEPSPSASKRISHVYRWAIGPLIVMLLFQLTLLNRCP